MCLTWPSPSPKIRIWLLPKGKGGDVPTCVAYDEIREGGYKAPGGDRQLEEVWRVGGAGVSRGGRVRFWKGIAVKETMEGEGRGEFGFAPLGGLF